MNKLSWPLMSNNISREDLDHLTAFLQNGLPILTQSEQVRAFEREWSDWLGVKHSVFVNSGSSANLITMAALAHTRGEGEIVVPTLTWVSDIASVLHCGLKPVFVDINPRTLGMDTDAVIRNLNERTRAVFLTHILGYNALDQRLLDELNSRGIPLIEDACESHGATYLGRKVGSFGLASNFSFYFAHHMSTIEGGMVSTNDDDLHQVLRMLRSHGMVREATDPQLRQRYAEQHSDLNPAFIFAFPAYNVRSTEINAVLGRSQLKRLDANNQIRTRNLHLFLECLDPERYQTDFATQGSSNYAFTLVLKHPDVALRDRVMAACQSLAVEFRRGASGGGNQLRQPYLRQRFPQIDPASFPCVDHIHFFGFYIGNYPELETDKIVKLCHALNEL